MNISAKCSVYVCIQLHCAFSRSSLLLEKYTKNKRRRQRNEIFWVGYYFNKIMEPSLLYVCLMRSQTRLSLRTIQIHMHASSKLGLYSKIARHIFSYAHVHPIALIKILQFGSLHLTMIKKQKRRNNRNSQCCHVPHVQWCTYICICPFCVLFHVN